MSQNTNCNPSSEPDYSRIVKVCTLGMDKEKIVDSIWGSCGVGGVNGTEKAEVLLADHELELIKRLRSNPDALAMLNEGTEYVKQYDSSQAMQIESLRRISGAGLIDCKKALEESSWDGRLALANLRTRGLAVAINWGGVKYLEQQLAAKNAEIAELKDLQWRTGTPEVKEGASADFFCAIKNRDGNVRTCILTYLNKYVMELHNDMLDVPACAKPIDDEGVEYEWTGWFDPYCDYCEAYYMFHGKVIGWIPCPAYEEEHHETP